MSTTDPASPDIREHLQSIRTAFLRLHKALLDSEKDQYERSYGPVLSAGAFFRLVIGNEWFSWLRPMSQYIVHVDETLAAKEPMTVEKANELLASAHQLIRSSEEGTPQERRYFETIQRDPNIAIMHAEVAKLLAAAAQV